MPEGSLWAPMALALIVLAVPAAAPRAADPPPALVWTQRPTADDVAAAYPPKALADHIGGRAVIGCAVAADGGLADCAVVSESPTGAGFGDAALGVVVKMRLDRTSGHPGVGERLNLPIRFAPPEVETGAAPPREVRFTKTLGGYESAGPAGPFYPERAFRRGQNGLALIQCNAAPDGALTACVMLADQPADQDFGNAALMMAKRGRILAAPRADGQPDTGEAQRFLVPFVLRDRR